MDFFSPINATEKLGQWSLHLSEVYFEVIHRAGIIYQVASALSRLLAEKADHSSLEDDVTAMLNADKADPKAAYDYP